MINHREVGPFYRQDKAFLTKFGQRQSYSFIDKLKICQYAGKDAVTKMKKTRAAGKETIKIDEMKDLKRKNDKDCQNVPSKVLRRSDRIKSLEAQRSNTDDQLLSSRDDIIEKEEKGIDRCMNDNDENDENTDKEENLGIVKTKDNENSEIEENEYTIKIQFRNGTSATLTEHGKEEKKLDENLCTVNEEETGETSTEHESEMSGIGKANEADHLIDASTEIEKTKKTDDTSLDEATVHKVQISENTQEETNSTVESINEENKCTTNVSCSEDTSTLTYERKKEEQKPERCAFRLLRDDESDTSDLVAKDPRSSLSVEYHVLNGSKGNSSRYISTCKSYDSVRRLVSLKRRGDTNMIRVVRINLDDVKTEIIDLTDPVYRERYLNSSRAKDLASLFEEILIVGRVPSSAYEVIYKGSKYSCPSSEPESDT
ncbi:hypothetical protein FSP39_001186 [Pinctada imbricata]|uniref:Uncharacterized protein n=1 Tax=Pinctada imbricata TaxID=66713 RepID=A0AA89C0C8_PINIB|nr:hypothetical protein FSP39_001186 [Pinctada imbricata]